MFEGKHIHYSQDNRLLCSYSNKLCKQRRLSGYAFCIKHILEDRDAPFKQCSYMAKYNKKCNNAIPTNDDRGFCNSHMVVAGLAPKKEKKPKKIKDNLVEDLSSTSDGKQMFADRMKAYLKTGSYSSSESSDDPYAFNDAESDSGPPTFRLHPSSCRVTTSTHPCIGPTLGPTKVVNPEADIPTTTMTPKCESDEHWYQSYRLAACNAVHELVPHLRNSIPTTVAVPTTSFPYPVPTTMSSVAIKHPVVAMAPSQSAYKYTSPFTSFVPKPFGSAPQPWHAMNSTVESKVMDEESSKTMNQLQAKIAQKKISVKHRKSCVPHQDLPSAHAPKALKADCGLPTMLRHPEGEHSLLEQQLLGLSSNHTVPSHAKMEASTSVQILRDCSHLPSLDDGCDAPSTSSHAVAPKTNTMENQIPVKGVRVPTYFETKLPQPITAGIDKCPKVLKHLDQILMKEREKKLNILPLGFTQSESDDTDEEYDIVVRLRNPTNESWEEKKKARERAEVRAVVDAAMERDHPGYTLSQRGRQRWPSERYREYQKLKERDKKWRKNRKERNEYMKTLIDAAKQYPDATGVVLESHFVKPEDRLKSPQKHLEILDNPLVGRHRCRYNIGEKGACRKLAIPGTWHCKLHIMYNVNQQAFQHCTAKFANNTQCCAPTIDTAHELPLCSEHARKRDNYDRMNSKLKPKRIRKKTKPSAMTRPSKRGKKKRKVMSPVPEEVNDFKEAAPVTPKVEDLQVMKESLFPQLSSSMDSSIQGTGEVGELGDIEEDVEVEMGEPLSPETICKGLELSSNTAELANHASSLLEEHDLTEVLNKISDDTFTELFEEGKNGDYEPTKEETEVIRRALEAVEKDVKTLDKLSESEMSLQEETILNANLDENTLSRIAQGGIAIDSLNLGGISNSELNSLSQAFCDVGTDTTVPCTMINSNEGTYATSQDLSAAMPMTEMALTNGMDHLPAENFNMMNATPNTEALPNGTFPEAFHIADGPTLQLVHDLISTQLGNNGNLVFAPHLNDFANGGVSDGVTPMMLNQVFPAPYQNGYMAQEPLVGVKGQAMETKHNRLITSTEQQMVYSISNPTLLNGPSNLPVYGSTLLTPSVTHPVMTHSISTQTQADSPS